MDTLKKNIPVLISVLALILSAGSLYVTSLKGANITLSVGDHFGLKHKDHYLYIFLPMVVHNTGAQAGLIHSFGVILKDQKSEEAIFLKMAGICQSGISAGRISLDRRIKCTAYPYLLAVTLLRWRRFPAVVEV